MNTVSSLGQQLKLTCLLVVLHKDSSLYVVGIKNQKRSVVLKDKLHFSRVEECLFCQITRPGRGTFSPVSGNRPNGYQHYTYKETVLLKIKKSWLSFSINGILSPTPPPPPPPQAKRNLHCLFFFFFSRKVIW